MVRATPIPTFPPKSQAFKAMAAPYMCGVSQRQFSMVPPHERTLSPHRSGRLRGSSGVVGPRAFFAFFMYFVWMSVTGILRVLGDGPEEGSEEVSERGQ